MYPVRNPLLAGLRWLPAAALVLSSMLIFGQAQTQPRNLTVDDLFAIRRVGDPRVSPDGQWIAYVTVVRPEIIWYATRHLAIAPSGGGDEEVLTASLDRHVSDPGFAADGSIYFVLEDSAERHLARIGPDGEGLQRLVADRLEVRSYHLGPEDMVASLVSRPAIPGEIFGLKDGELVRLSHVNDELMSQLQLATVENVHFPSREGAEIEGFIFKPPDFDEKFRYPTLLRIHGGPVAQYDFGEVAGAGLFSSPEGLRGQVDPSDPPVDS